MLNTVCINEDCKIRKQCYRFLAHNSEFGQTYSLFSPNEDGTCDDKIEHKQEVKNEQRKN
jgi:hypothetical protein